jgi:hypothetical protein
MKQKVRIDLFYSKSGYCSGIIPFTSTIIGCFLRLFEILNNGMSFKLTVSDM